MRRALSVAFVTACLMAPAWLTQVARADAATSGVIAAGAEHTCAVFSGGAVRCWGNGEDGRLGYADDRNVGDGVGPPVNAVGDVELPGTVTSVAAGAAHSCARLTDGSVHCWGSGQGGLVDLPAPADSVSAGAEQTCVVLGPDARPGEVMCWAAGGVPSVVGLPDPAAVVAAGPQESCAAMESGGVACWDQAHDVWEVPLDQPVAAVAVGSSLSCALDDTAAVWCWTQNTDPEPIDLAGTPLEIAAGGDRACALLEGDPAVACWGEDGSASLVWPAGEVVALGVGREHVCVALSDGTPDCWGEGGSGRLGYGDTRGRTAPAGATGAGTQQVFGGGPQREGPHDGESGGGGWLLVVAAGVLVVAGSGAGYAVVRKRRVRT